MLCGGQSRRMGRSKAWLPFGDEVLLQRVVRVLGEVAESIVVVAGPGQALPPLPSSVVIVRDPVAHQGPLRGIATGLAALPATVELVYASSTDAPFLRQGWVTRLAELIGENDLAIPEVGGFLHPLAALYRRATTLPAAETLLAADRLRPVFLLETLQGRVVTPEELRPVDPELETLRNLNTPEDYELALRKLGG